MKHANKKYYEQQRRKELSIRANFVLIASAIFALLLMAFAGVSIANGFGSAKEQPRIDDTPATVSQTSEAIDDESTEKLKQSSTRNVSALVSQIEVEEAQKLKAEQEAQAAHDKECIDNANSRKSKAGAEDDGVDFNIGRDAFVALWGERIDNYLAGSPMAGCGKTYANAAFEYGVDPRVSPAISNTESSKGAYCFRPHNAWGWMSGAGWADWDSAIEAHVKGLSEKYPYTVTEAFAKKYCPPTYEDWYKKTLNQINKI